MKRKKDAYEEFLQLQQDFHQYEENERKCQEQLATRWNKLKTKVERAQEKLNFYMNRINEISWGAKSESIDCDGLNERVRISLAGSFYEAKRAALVETPPIGWNRLSCLFKKRWEKFLFCDKSGRIYFDYESDWMKPILKALKGEEADDIILDKSANTESARNIILKRFKTNNNIKFNVVQEIRYEDIYSSYSSSYSKKRKLFQVIPVALTTTPSTVPERPPATFGLTDSSGNNFFESNDVLREQLSLLNQSSSLQLNIEDVLAKVHNNLRLFLEELSFMREYLYSEWKGIIPSLPPFDNSELTDDDHDTDDDDDDDGGDDDDDDAVIVFDDDDSDDRNGAEENVENRDTSYTETSIEKHVQYFATIFPMIQEYKHRVKSASSTAERIQLDALAYFNVEGETMTIKKSTIMSVFAESQLAVRLSGRWTEQSNDVDDEGNIYCDVSSVGFRALLQYARFRALCKREWITFPSTIKASLNGLIDYFSIDRNAVSILYDY